MCLNWSIFNNILGCLFRVHYYLFFKLFVLGSLFAIFGLVAGALAPSTLAATISWGVYGI